MPRAIGMPREILEPATPPKAILRRWCRELLQNVAHESPPFQVSQRSEVAEHARKIRPDQRIDPRDIGAAKAKVDPCSTGLECSGRIVESGGACAKDSDALSD